MKYFCLGDEDSVLGFSLVGVSGTVVKNTVEAETAWEKVLENKENAVIIITESIANMIRTTVDRYLFSESFPLVVEIPDKGGRFSRDLKTLVNESIGVAL